MDAAHEKIRVAESKIAAAKESLRVVQVKVDSEKGAAGQPLLQSLELAQRELSLAYFAQEVALKELDMLLSHAVCEGGNLDPHEVRNKHTFHKASTTVRAAVRISSATKLRAARLSTSFDDIEGSPKTFGKEPQASKGSSFDMFCWDFSAAQLRKFQVFCEVDSPAELAKV
jgi:hypothetical protein